MAVTVAFDPAWKETRNATVGMITDDADETSYNVSI